MRRVIWNFKVVLFLERWLWNRQPIYMLPDGTLVTRPRVVPRWKADEPLERTLRDIEEFKHTEGLMKLRKEIDDA